MPFQEKYSKEVAPDLVKKFGYKNKMAVPKLVKIVVNTSLKEGAQDMKVLEAAAQDIAAVIGQKPVITRARKSIANFKLRAGQAIGCMATLRRKRMYEFFNRLVNVALPRVRDFKGVSPKSFDTKGNYTLGLQEQTLFFEINRDKVARVFGMNVTFVTTAKTNEEGKELLRLLGMPFRN